MSYAEFLRHKPEYQEKEVIVEKYIKETVLRELEFKRVIGTKLRSDVTFKDLLVESKESIM